MKIMNKWIVSLCFVLMLFGCQSGDGEEEGTITTSPISEGGYRIAMPFTASDATQVHIEFKRSDYDVNAIGKGLQNYAKEHFSPSKYYLQDGQILKRSNLVSSQNNSEALLARKSADNPFGLNPEVGFSLPINKNDAIKVGNATVPVGDVIEYDFVTETTANADIEGVAFAIVLNTEVIGEDGKKYTIEDDQLKILGEEAGRNLITYVKDLPQIKANTPVLITLFKATSSDSNLPGVFFAQGYGRANIDNFSEIKEEWVIIPSETASKLDPQISTQFESVKNALFRFLPNDIGIVGKGFFIDNQLNELQITITTQGKSLIQNESVVQYTKELLAKFGGDYYKIVVKMNADTETFAMLLRSKGSNEVISIME